MSPPSVEPSRHFRGAERPVVSSVAVRWVDQLSAGSRGTMATTTNNTNTTVQPARQQQQQQDDTFSVVVETGRDNWAGQVIENVVGSEEELREEDLTPVENKILEKKRLFHASRCLELKNLPDGVREEVKYWDKISSATAG